MIERLSTGIPSFDKLIAGGIPRGFFVAVVGEPGTGKSLPPEEEVVVITRRGFKIVKIRDVWREFSDSPLFTLAITKRDLRVSAGEVAGVYVLNHSGVLLDIKTSSGAAVKVTPDHSLIVLKPNGLSTVKARELNYVRVKVPVIKISDRSLECKLVFDEIARIRKESYEGPVYDLSVNVHENFLTGSGVVVHNSVFCQHFIAQGIKEGDKNIYITTEESRDSIINQAKQFGWNFEKAIDEGKLVIIDALMRGRDDPWSLQELDVEHLINKIIEAKKYLGFGRARLVVDSMSAFWLDKPAMARKYSYYVKRVLSRWDFTALLVSQYAVTTSLGFGFGIEHVADGIIRFKRMVVGGKLRRFLIVEKMRQTPHDLYLHEIEIKDGVGMIIKRATPLRREDTALPRSVMEKMIEAELKKDLELPFEGEE